MLKGITFSKLKRDNVDGFTLIELLIVIAIIGVLVVIVVIAIDPVRVINDSNDTKTRAELTQVKTSLQLYFNENNSYPGSLSLLEPVYIRDVPTGITYGESGANYDAWVSVNISGTTESDSHTKCVVNDGNNLAGGGGSANYWICPD